MTHLAPKPAANPARKRDLAAIHVAKKALGWDDDHYRGVLLDVCKVRSSADLDNAGRRRWLRHLETCLDRTQPAPKRQPVRKPLTGPQRKVWSLWMQLADKGLVTSRTMAAINDWVTRQTGVNRLEWLTTAQEELVTESLKKWLQRGTE
jgi:phage gp16-like protein